MGLGEACSKGADCASSFCYPNVCVDGALGSPCDDGTDCQSTVCVGGLCANGSVGSPCVAPGDCRVPNCIGGHGAGNVGDACTSDGACVQGHCYGGQCTSGALGAGCDGAPDCTSGICVTNACRDGLSGSQCVSDTDCIGLRGPAVRRERRLHGGTLPRRDAKGLHRGRASRHLPGQHALSDHVQHRQRTLPELSDGRALASKIRGLAYSRAGRASRFANAGSSTSDCEIGHGACAAADAADCV
jgi:hypothetical protein